jgi:hypothetical protein
MSAANKIAVNTDAKSKNARMHRFRILLQVSPFFHMLHTASCVALLSFAPANLARLPWAGLMKVTS